MNLSLTDDTYPLSPRILNLNSLNTLLIVSVGLEGNKMKKETNQRTEDHSSQSYRTAQINKCVAGRQIPNISIYFYV